jgi:hypothetical protein
MAGCVLKNGGTFTMSHKSENLLREAGRSMEVLIGWVCALIGVTFAVLLIWLFYIVAWRNPHEFGVNDLYRLGTLMIFGVLLSIAIGFLVVAFRLTRRTSRQFGLMSPTFLRIWGSFFALSSAVVLIDGIVTKRWREVPHYWGVLTSSVTMAGAAFVLAKRRERGKESENSNSQQDGAANQSQPVHPSSHRPR